MTTLIIILFVLNIYLFVLIKKEQKYRRITETILSGFIDFSLNNKDKDRMTEYKYLIGSITNSMGNAFGANKFKSLIKDSELFKETSCNEQNLNQIYNLSVSDGYTELKQTEKENANK